ncbi:transposase family protein, partial [Pontibacter sp. 13R65]|uniref:transposase family protein n=1 Tax=Pontibacter sp. 13R65 TaxID=3127458 RepID=UPI00301C3B3F
MQTTNDKEPNRSEYLPLTSLQPEEFIGLLSEFGPLCEQFFEDYNLEGNPRRIPKFREDARCSLAGSFNKLLFLLSYLKENPRQHYHGRLWGMKQPRVSKWVKLLLPLLEQALARLQVLPKRFGCQLYAFLLSFTRFVLLMDATERGIPRSVVYERQKHEYSGKKKTHTVKNNLITDQRGSILFLSSTYPGSVHDKTMADQAGHQFPDHTVLVEDLGYLGYGPENVSVLIPNK